jgi:hypothetical protein
MKYITSALVVIALLGGQNTSSAIRINSKAAFTDDLVKSLAEEMNHDAGETQEEPAAAPAKPAPAAKVAIKHVDNHTKAAQHSNATKNATATHKAAAQVKKAVKAEEEEIPMDSAAIKAYSSVIADAAEDSEPATPVTYSATMEEERAPVHEVVGLDPMGSMI